MSESTPTATQQDRRSDRFAYDPDTQPQLFEGVLSKRIVAFVVDAVLIVVLMIPAALVVFVLGVFTLGIGFLLYPILFLLVALGYVGLTLGGPNSATVGMRMAGLEMRTWNGAPMFAALAIIHALLFWFSISILTPFILLVGLFTRRRQLLHDLLLGTVVLNSWPLHQLEK